MVCRSKSAILSFLQYDSVWSLLCVLKSWLAIKSLNANGEEERNTHHDDAF